MLIEVGRLASKIRLPLYRSGVLRFAFRQESEGAVAHHSHNGSPIRIEENFIVVRVRSKVQL